MGLRNLAGAAAIFESNAPDPTNGSLRLDHALAAGGVRRIPIALVDTDPEQPRTYFDEEKLAELADELAIAGQRIPAHVESLPNGRYRLVAGERRLRACRLKGIETLLCVVHPKLSDDERVAITQAENQSREPVHPFDQARYDQRQIERGMTARQLAKNTGRSDSAVSESLAIARLPEQLHVPIRENYARFTHASLIAIARAEPAAQPVMVDKAVTEGLSVREARAAAVTSRPKSLRRSNPIRSVHVNVVTGKASVHVGQVPKGGSIKAVMLDLLGELKKRIDALP